MTKTVSVLLFIGIVHHLIDFGLYLFMKALLLLPIKGSIISQVLIFYCITCPRSKSGTNYNHNGAAELTIKIGLLAYHAKLHCNGPVKLLKRPKRNIEKFSKL